MPLHPKTVYTILRYVVSKIDLSTLHVFKEVGDSALVDTFFKMIEDHLSDENPDIALQYFVFDKLTNKLGAIHLSAAGHRTLANIATEAFSRMTLPNTLKEWAKKTRQYASSDDVENLLSQFKKLNTLDADFGSVFDELLGLGKSVLKTQGHGLSEDAIAKLLGGCLFDCIFKGAIVPTKAIYQNLTFVVKQLNAHVLNESIQLAFSKNRLSRKASTVMGIEFQLNTVEKELNHKRSKSHI